MRFSTSKQLAILGGPPVANAGDWPSWPRWTPATREALLRVGVSGRWTVSGPAAGAVTEEDAFAAEFARFCGTRACVPVDHGSSALVIALEACGLERGDEVLVPGLTWVACASAVVRAGGTPVLVDVDPETLCMSPAAAAARVTARTRGVLLVHLYCSIGDLDAFTALCHSRGAFLIEDAAQMHGARWRGHRVGTIGRVGTFSMQQGKLLTAGEGGACVTDDLAIAEKMYLLRTDGRRHAGQVAPGRMELDDVGGVLGRNFCLSEFQAACLRAQLGELEDLNNQRWNTAQRLRAALADVPGVSLPRSSAGTERESYYHFIAFFEPAAFGDCPVEIVAEAISGELGFWVHPVYDPLYRHPLASLWLREGERSHSREEANRGNYPGCERVRSCAIAFHHPVLLAGDAGIARIIAAVEKVRANADSLPLSFRANRGATS